MTQMRKILLSAETQLTTMDLAIDTDIGGYAYYSFHFVARATIGQAAGELIMNDTGTSVSFDVRSTVAPNTVTLNQIITFDVQYVEGRRVVLYTAPSDLEFFYLKNKAFG
jgi:hypothetical protein